MQRGTGRGTAGCSNVQTAVDAKHKRIVACEVTHDPGDRDGRSPMALPAQAVLAGRCDAGADMGSDHGHEGKGCREAGITPSVSRPRTSAHEKLGLFRKEDGTSHRATDTSQCPAGAQRTCRFDTVERGRHIRSDATSACTGCVRKPQGTRHTGGRRLTRGVEEQLLEEMEQRVRRRPEGMKRRKTLGEHLFGTMKRGGTRAPFAGAGWRRCGRSAVGRSWRTPSGGCCTSSRGRG
jgi:hypothetical protein